jgi:epoxyqueuosine reductase
VLLHICCGPCAVWPVRQLRAAGFAPTGFWYNPNVHPYQEYSLRLASCQAMSEALDLPLDVRDEYALETHLDRVLPLPRGPVRCAECYRMRLSATAERALQLGYSAISTTLLVSPYQHHDHIAGLGREVAEKSGLAFVYQDWRAGFRAGSQEAGDLGLYRQKYCGCVLSEADRYAPPRVRPVRGGGQ